MAKKAPPRSSKKKASSANPLLFVLLGLAVVVIAALLILRGGGEAGQSAALPQEISAAQAAAKREAGAFILDVREPDEWEQAHIPGATLIPLGQLEARANEVPDDREVVVVCRSGNRSAAGRDILLSAGFGSVTSMAGGMNEWRAGGYPTTSGP
jgi:rhodanese-related sulfurtransferase